MRCSVRLSTLRKVGFTYPTSPKRQSVFIITYLGSFQWYRNASSFSLHVPSQLMEDAGGLMGVIEVE